MCCIGEWGCTDFWKKEKEKIYMEKKQLESTEKRV